MLTVIFLNGATGQDIPASIQSGAVANHLVAFNTAPDEIFASGTNTSPSAHVLASQFQRRGRNVKTQLCLQLDDQNGVNFVKGLADMTAVPSGDTDKADRTVAIIGNQKQGEALSLLFRKRTVYQPGAGFIATARNGDEHAVSFLDIDI